jgi:hypothetical protein
MEIKGVIVRDYSRLPVLPNTKPYPFKWRDLALSQGLMVMYTTTSTYFPELYYDNVPMQLLDSMIYEVIEKYAIPKENVFMGGISASGTRALKYAQYCNQGKSKFGIKINGVFAVDSPLDLERFYYSALNNGKYFMKGMKSEAEMMLQVFPERLGYPGNKKATYTKASVYSYMDKDGGNASHLKSTSVLLIHEPDIDWWIKERGATYFDINSFDNAGMYNYLKNQKHLDVELLTTTGKGFDRNGNRKCHSWTIVDEGYLISWITSRLK